MGAHVSVPMYHRALAQRLRLEGSRCASCGHVAFPPRPTCADCRSDEAVPSPLSGRGVLYAWTRIAAAGAPPEFAALARREGPYLVGIVTLEEGPRITGMLTGFQVEPPIGTPVRAVVRQLYEEEGVIRYGFKFRPG